MTEVLWCVYVLIGLYTARIGATGPGGIVFCVVTGALWPLTWLVALLIFLSLPPD